LIKTPSKSNISMGSVSDSPEDWLKKLEAVIGQRPPKLLSILPRHD